MLDVELIDARPGLAPACVLRIDELRVEGRFDASALVGGAPEIHRLVAKRPQVCLVRQRGGGWNLQRIRLPTGGERPPPKIVVEDATLYLTDETRPAAPATVVRNATASISPATEGRLAVTVSAENTIARRATATGVLSPDGAAFDGRFEVEGLVLSDDLVASAASLAGLPTDAVSSRARGVRGRVAVRGSARRAGAGSAIEWDASFAVAEGEARIAGLKRAVTELSAEGTAQPGHLAVDRLAARWGDASILAAGRRIGAGPEAPTALRLRVEPLDARMVPIELLPPLARRLWDRFAPEGIADLAVDAQFDGRRWAPRATLACHGASFEDGEKFRYRLTGGSGRIDLNGGALPVAPGAPAPPTWDPSSGSRMDVDLTAMVDQTPIHIGAALTDLESCCSPINGRPRPAMPLGWVEIQGRGVTITPPLVAAIPEERTRQLVRDLRPSGHIDIRWRADRVDAGDPRVATSLDLRLVGCKIDYARFPYPLAGVGGWIRQRGPEWTFRELVSIDPASQKEVRGEGEITPTPGGPRFVLRLEGLRAPLDDELRAALPPDAQRAWDFLRPRGALDFAAEVTQLQGDSAPAVRLAMWPHERSVTVEPTLSTTGYRYRLERLDGRFDWEANRLTMTGARAEHGATAYAANGLYEPSGDGGWMLRLTDLYADRLAPNHDFLLAAPVGLRSVLETLRPRGGFDLQKGALEVRKRGASGDAAEARWDLGLNLHQARLDAGLELEGISGTVRLVGSTDGASASTAAELDLDSLFWNDLQLTEVRGPLWADGAECLLGSGVARHAGGKPLPVTARAYGGDVELDARVQHGGRPRYGLKARLRGVDVGRLSAEWLQRPEALRGAMDGGVELIGAGTSIYGLEGRGDLAIRDADLYQLPMFVRLLKVLRNRAPDGTAFDRVEAKFALRGEQVSFEKLDLLGDAVSMYGRGEASLDHHVDLVFHTVVGRGELVGPIARAVFGQASEQLMRLRVTGTTDQPDIRREALPIVGNIFEQLQTELGQRGEAARQPGDAGQEARARPPSVGSRPAASLQR